MIDTVEVLSHHAFADLLKDAKVLLEATLGERAKDAKAVTNPVPGVNAPGIAVSTGTVVDSTATTPTSMVIELPGSTPARVATNQTSLFDGEGGGGETADTHVGMGFATVENRLGEAAAAEQTLATTLKPRAPGGVKIPLFLPRVTTRWERDQFSLADVNLVNVEALGRQFADDEGVTLERKALDAVRGDDGTVELRIHDETEAIMASQLRMPFDTIESDLARRLLQTNGVAATVSEANAATAVAKAFLTGAEVSAETPWRPEHGRLATARLVEWISNQQTSKPAREVRDVTQVKWPDVIDRIETREPADRQLIASSKQFVRGYPYKGWVRSVYEVNSFDAFSTEFRLAALFDVSPGVKAWVRIDQSVPLRINYLMGAIQREYEPDFIVIDDAGVHWIVEGKSDIEMTNPVVIAKADAARAWVVAVNASDNVSQKWGYILANESVIAAASNWNAIKNGAGAFMS